MYHNLLFHEIFSLLHLPINQIFMKEIGPILSEKTLYWIIFLSTGILQLNDDKDVNLSFNNLFKRVNAILDNHAPLRKVTKKKLRFRSKTMDNFRFTKIHFH